MARDIYIFSGGGTGGHLYTGLAVAAELTALRPEARVVFACSGRDIDRRILAPQRYALVAQPIRPLPPGPADVLPFVRAWRASGRLARDLIRDLKPSAVLGLGGFAAAQPVRHAARAGVRAALLNPDAVPGKANRYLARHAGVIFTQFESTRDSFTPRARRKVRCVGCPVRAGLPAGDRLEAARHFGIEPDRRTLLVLGGSLGAESLNRAFAVLAGEMSGLAETWQVIHITGAVKCASSARGPCRAKIPGPRCGELAICTREYCDRMDLAFAAADVVLCRAGASTVAEVTATGTPAVFMPYPWHGDRHQRLNAAELAAAGAAVVIDDAADAAANAAALAGKLLPILAAPSRLKLMADAAAALARPNAAREVAGWLAG